MCRRRTHYAPTAEVVSWVSPRQRSFLLSKRKGCSRRLVDRERRRRSRTGGAPGPTSTSRTSILSVSTRIAASASPDTDAVPTRLPRRHDEVAGYQSRRSMEVPLVSEREVVKRRMSVRRLDALLIWTSIDLSICCIGFRLIIDVHAKTLIMACRLAAAIIDTN